jgi:hypothetical protein
VKNIIRDDGWVQGYEGTVLLFENVCTRLVGILCVEISKVDNVNSDFTEDSELRGSGSFFSRHLKVSQNKKVKY